MNSDDSQPLSGAAPSGNPLPDLAYVSQLFTALSGSDSEIAVGAANESVDASHAEEPTPMSDQSASVIVLPAQCLLRDAVELKPQLLEHAELPEVQIEISALERIDAAFMQVLLALAKQRKAAGRSALQWSGTSQVFSDAVRILGLTDYLPGPVAA